MCSTPFGIEEVGGAGGRDTITAGQAQCSTPFGIEEVGGRARRLPTPAVIFSAQRLSASKRLAVANGHAFKAKDPLVLNAFRHRRGWRTNGRP